MHNLWVRLLFQSFLGCRLLHPQFKRRTAVGTSCQRTRQRDTRLSGFEVHTVDMFFECLTESFDGAKAEDDAAEIIILPANQLNPDDFGLQSIKKAVDRYIK